MPMSNERKKKSGLRKTLAAMVILPIVIVGLVVMAVCYSQFYKTMTKEIGKELKNAAIAVEYNYENIYSGTIAFVTDDDGSYIVDEGETSVKLDDSLIWSIKQHTDIDTTVFYYDIRIMSTLEDTEGESVVGTVANKYVTADVINNGNEKLYDNTDIGGEEYYAFYTPVISPMGETVGMIFAGRPTNEVKKSVFVSVLPVLVIVLIACFIAAFTASKEAEKIADAIHQEEIFLGEIAKGNLRAELDSRILGREDELGEMGKFTVKVQLFLKDMIERDGLTKLYTRRIGEQKIMSTRNDYIEAGSPYCVVMCDIDHFKKFNDTYGHDCGDLVLRSVADVINKTTYGKGYGVRWGGEEFIIIFEKTNKDDGITLLNQVRDAVLANEVEYNGEQLKITMTYGLVEGDDRSIEEITKDVDELLYIGKEGGRNRIVTG